MIDETSEMKKRLVHQLTEDFYSRFESNDDKLERLRRLQQNEVVLPHGFEVEGEVRAPSVSEMHTMLLTGQQARMDTLRVTRPRGSRTMELENTDGDPGQGLDDQ